MNLGIGKSRWRGETKITQWTDGWARRLRQGKQKTIETSEETKEHGRKSSHGNWTNERSYAARNASSVKESRNWRKKKGIT